MHLWISKALIGFTFGFCTLFFKQKIFESLFSNIVFKNYYQNLHTKKKNKNLLIPLFFKTNFKNKKHLYICRYTSLYNLSNMVFLGLKTNSIKFANLFLVFKNWTKNKNFTYVSNLFKQKTRSESNQALSVSLCPSTSDHAKKIRLVVSWTKLNLSQTPYVIFCRQVKLQLLPFQRDVEVASKPLKCTLDNIFQ